MARATGASTRAVLTIEPPTFHSLDEALQRLARFVGHVPDWRDLPAFCPRNCAARCSAARRWPRPSPRPGAGPRRAASSCARTAPFGPIYLRSPRRAAAMPNERAARPACVCSRRCCSPRPSRSPKTTLARRLGDGRGCRRRCCASLREAYAGRGVNLVRLAGGWTFRTAPDLAPEAAQRARRSSRKLSRAAVETLAIVAYHQPVTRAEIEAIRGVALARGTLDRLMEAGWVRPKGRRDEPGPSADLGDDPGLSRAFRARQPERIARHRGIARRRPARYRPGRARRDPAENRQPESSRDRPS